MEELRLRLFEALKEMESPVKTATADIPMRGGGKYSYDYATLKDVSDIVKSTLDAHGLWVVQQCEYYPGEHDTFILTTTVTDGKESMRVDQRPIMFGSDAQKSGAYETYMRRYALLTAFGLCPIDTDAVETRGASLTSEDLRTRILRGIEALKDLGVDTDTVLCGFEGWETDSRVAQRYIHAIEETYRQSKMVQEQFPGTEIGA